MILMHDIIREGDERLKQKSKDVVTPVSEEDINLLKDMLEYVHNSVDDEIGPKYADRNGGYTTVIKTGNRRGDNAPMAIIKLVD